MKPFDYLQANLAEKLLKVNDPRKQALTALMMKAGLRVSETVTLQFQNFDFQKNTITVKTLKKRKGKELNRTIPISKELYQILAKYISTLKNHDPESYLFPSNQGKEPHLSRKTAWYYYNSFKKKNPEFANYRLRPHILRHTFGTNLANGKIPLHQIRDLMGHAKIDITAQYAHSNLQLLEQAVTKVDNETPLKRLKSWIFPQKKIYINSPQKHDYFTVGRTNELHLLTENASKNINTIILGGIGIGKSHLLKNLATTNKVLLIDDLSDLKNTLINTLLYLLEGDKEAIKTVLFPNLGTNEIRKHLTKMSVANLTAELIQRTIKHEYTLLIDNVDRITPKAVETIEKLKDHFCIITSAREVLISKSSFLWNFDRIKLNPLDRKNSLELIYKLSYDLPIPDLEEYQNHIYENTAGNPRAIFEMVDRYRKEDYLTSDKIKSMKHTGALKEIDMTGFYVVVLGAFVILRYLGSETGEDSFKFIGGVALVLLIFAKYLLKFTKRRVI